MLERDISTQRVTHLIAKPHDRGLTMHRSPFFAAVAAAALLACDTTREPTAPSIPKPSLAVLLNEKIPVAGTLVNPCSGDAAAVEGVFHIVVRETVDQNGGDHLGFHINTQGITGTDPEGDRFVLKEVVDQEINIGFTKGAASEATITQDVMVVEGGPEDNFVGKAVFHITINANGEITAEFLRFEVECRG